MISFFISMAALGVLVLLFTTSISQHPQTFRVPASMDNIRSIVEKVTESAKEAQLDQQALYQCRLAIDEACTNIIEHAYADKDGEIEVVVKVQDGLEIHLIDFGEPYNPADVPAPPIGSSLEKMTPGGLGLYLMRMVMDEVRYQSSPYGNRLTMIKRR